MVAVEVRKGHRVLGCCDARIAVWIADIMILLLEMPQVYSGVVDGFDIEKIILIAATGVFTLLSMLGALIYNRIMLIFMIIYAAGQLGAVVFFYIQDENDDSETRSEARDELSVLIASCLVCGVVLYPHITLLMQISRGVMSRETYSREHFFGCFC